MRPPFLSKITKQKIMKKIYLFIFLMGCLDLCYGQYIESFDIPNQGILAGPCGANDPASCASSDFSAVSWTIGGNLSGIDSEGFFTKNGYLHSEDLDEEACWISPNINIQSVAVASVEVTFTIPTGASWETSTTPGSIDYMDVKYSVDGGPFVTIANVNGCPGSGHTLSVSTCGASLVGPMTFNIDEGGIVGSQLNIQVCIDTNASSDDGFLEEVRVPELGATLPVTWAKVDVEKVEKGNLVEWSTSTEINNDRFEIQRTTDPSEDFKTIGTVAGNGNSTVTTSYEFMDERVSLNADYLYYRIMQIDFDGKYSYSKIVSIRNKNKVERALVCYPNPVTHSLTISNKNERLEDIESLQIFNSQGQLVDVILNPFNSQKEINYNLSNLNVGMYFIKPVINNTTSTLKIIKFNKVN